MLGAFAVWDGHHGGRNPSVHNQVADTKTAPVCSARAPAAELVPNVRDNSFQHGFQFVNKVISGGFDAGRDASE
jgi:hypothetical protein